ncbi:MAG: hypothetical protein ACKOGA_10970 [Planctomycetaceae bacterium]
MADSRTLHTWAQRLAEPHALRWNREFQYHLGLYRGVCYRIFVWDGVLRIQCSCPSVSLVDQILSDFAAADRLRGAGIRQEWLSGAMSELNDGAGVDSGSLVVELDPQRLQALGERGADGLLELLAGQFHDWGADERVNCSRCQPGDATEVAVVNDVLTPLCDSCWETFRKRWPTGRAVVQPSGPPIWKWVWILAGAMIAVTVLLILAVQLYVTFG